MVVTLSQALLATCDNVTCGCNAFSGCKYVLGLKIVVQYH